MPKYIPNRHIRRMFPYAFFGELYDVLVDYTPENPVFSLRETDYEQNLDTDRQAQFQTERKKAMRNKKLEENNIYTVDQGSFLILEKYMKRSDRDAFINKKPYADYALAVQYFDSSDQPVFAPDVKIETIRQIPEILWDDPRLAIILIPITPSDPDELEETNQVQILKGPDCFINAFIEDKPEQQNSPEKETHHAVERTNEERTSKTTSPSDLS